MVKKAKRKKSKKQKGPGNNILILISIVILIFVVFLSSNYIFKTDEKVPKTTTTIVATTTLTTSTTIPTIQTCSNFSWYIDDVEEFELAGSYKNILVDLKTQYMGYEEGNYVPGMYDFKILDSGGKYYSAQEGYYRCAEEDAFKLGRLNTGDESSGCLEFRILDVNEPTKLIFYDYFVHTLCEIHLP